MREGSYKTCNALRVLSFLLSGAKKMSELRPVISNYFYLKEAVRALKNQGLIRVTGSSRAPRRGIVVSLTDAGRTVAEGGAVGLLLLEADKSTIKRWRDSQRAVAKSIIEEIATHVQLCRLGLSRHKMKTVSRAILQVYLRSYFFIQYLATHPLMNINELNLEIFSEFRQIVSQNEKLDILEDINVFVAGGTGDMFRLLDRALEYVKEYQKFTDDMDIVSQDLASVANTAKRAHEKLLELVV